MKEPDTISPALIKEVCARLADNKPVKQPLPGGGMLNIERLVPFLCLYRRDPKRRDPGTQRFVTSESAYLTAPGNSPAREGLRELIRSIARLATQRLGSFLLLEVWSGKDNQVPRTKDESTGEVLLPAPRFRILTRIPHRPDGATAKLEFALQRLKAQGIPATVDVSILGSNHPPGMRQILSQADCNRIGCHVMGLEIRPIFRDGARGEVFEAIFRPLRRGVARSLKQAFFAFALYRTKLRPEHFYSFGRQKLPRQLYTIDRQLAEISSQFKFLLLLTPINAARAWKEFSESGFERLPHLVYRPQGADPLLLKRRLLNVRTERIEDPTLARLMRETQTELDRQLNMLGDVGTKRFLYGSLQVFGGVEPALEGLAEDIFRRWPESEHGPEREPREQAGAREFARRANAEIKYYRGQSPAFVGQAIVRADMYSGLLSTGGNLLIGRQTSVAKSRVDALLQHEIGTHLVTYYNGQAQPLRMLKSGLAGYDALQEGLAVLAEYLVRGISAGRLRTLAARVLATKLMIHGSAFHATFQHLTGKLGFEPKEAFTIVLRVYRGGGLTKDAVYLRGLAEILEYVRKDGDLEPLLVGKIAQSHIPIVRELLYRGMLKQPLLRPRYLTDPRVAERLERLRNGATVLDLVEA